jgi:DNA polymerase-3 subunit beta
VTETLTQPVAPATEQAPTAPAEPAAWMKPNGGPAFIANRGELLAALTALRTLTTERTPKAILNTYRITAAERLTVEATRLEQTGRCEAEQVQIERPGVACIPAEKLRDCVSRATGDTVAVDCGGSKASVRSGGAAYNLFCADPGTWPFPEDAAFPEPLGSVPSRELLRLVRQCQTSISDAAGRYAFTGLLLTVDTGKLTAVATDGRRMAVAATPWPGKPFPPAVLPQWALKALIPNLPEDGEVGVWVGGEAGSPPAAAFLCPDGYALRTGLLEGQFPPYGDVLPTGNDKRLESDRDALLDVLGQASVFVPSDGTTGALRLSLSAGRGLTITARDPMAGDAEAVLPCKFTGADLEWGANATYLAEAVAGCVGPGVAVEFTASNRPCLVTDGGSDYRNVVMPVTLR